MLSVPWTVRALDRGRTAFEYFTADGTRVRLEVFDGGGFVASHGVWRVNRNAVFVVPAFVA